MAVVTNKFLEKYMEVQGRIKQIGPVQTFGANGFQKRELVVVTEEQYPQPILIEFTQGNCSLLDSLKEGQLVRVSINLRGREWTNPQGEVKYFNSVVGWRIELIQTTTIQNTTTPQQPMPEATNATEAFEPYNGNANAQEDFDDLPF